MGKSDRGSLEREGLAALEHMETALRLLDTLDLSVEAAGHLDLAIHRLRESLESAGGKPDVKPPSG
jgi:hypothetical protein